MATCKLNAEQFANFTQNSAGIVLVYQSTNKDGITVETAHHFWGAEYEAAEKSQDEVFRVWKNVVATFWAVKQKETDLRVDNDGIRSKLRASTPARIIFNTSNGERIKSYDLVDSVWQKIGLVPTKKDLERTARDYKKAIHAATKASFEALGFRVELPKSLSETETTDQVVTEQKIEQKPVESAKETPKRGRPAKETSQVQVAA